MILSTDKENQYPKFLKICLIPVENKMYVSNFVKKRILLDKNSTLNTDGTNAFNDIKDLIQLNSEKIVHTKDNESLKWLHIIIGNIKNNITGIYHGVPKRSLPLFMQEQEWRFNHRNTGTGLLKKIGTYILKSSPMPDNLIKKILDISEPSFSKPVS